LKLQFPKYSLEEMESMLREDGIAIVDQEYKPKKERYFRRKQ